MTDVLLASTRKGLFLLEREAGEWEIRRTAFLGDSVSLAYLNPESGHLWVSSDQRDSWRLTAGHLSPIHALAFAEA